MANSVYRFSAKEARSIGRQAMQNATLTVDINKRAVCQGLWGIFGWRRCVGVFLLRCAVRILRCRIEVTDGP